MAVLIGNGANNYVYANSYANRVSLLEKIVAQFFVFIF